MDKVIRKVKTTISKYRMIKPRDRVVVAVSGGPDSVCLLSILNELKGDLGIEVITAHFDHGLRPLEDEDETRFVHDLSDSLTLPFVAEKAKQLFKEGKGTLEEKARHERYGFFKKVKKDFSAQKIAVGHTLNDQAETVLMRLLRGSGPSGLGGILPCRDNEVIRPLIETSRKEVMRYLEQKGLEYVTDSSNSEIRFLRNRIRLEILPALMEIQPRIIERLGQTAQIMRRDDEWMTSESVKWIKGTAENKGYQEIQFPLPAFKKLPTALKHHVVRQGLGMAGGGLRRIGRCHIDAVNSLAEGSKPQARIDLPNGLIVKKIYDRLVFKRGPAEGFKAFSYPLNGPGTFALPELNGTVSLEEFDPMDLPDKPHDKWTAFLNADQMAFPLVIRNFRAGDRFIPFGMSGHRKVKDFFIDLKIPFEERPRIPILTYHDEPVWVCGFRIDDRYKVTPRTKRVLKVTLGFAPKG